MNLAIGLFGAVLVFSLFNVYFQGSHRFLSEFFVSFLPLTTLINLIMLVSASLLFAGQGISYWEIALGVVTLLTVAFNCLTIVRFGFIKTKASTASVEKNFKLISFNKLVTIPNDQQIIEKLTELDADVIGLLEVEPKAVELYQKSLGYKNVMVYPYKTGIANYLLLSKYPVVSSKLIPIDTFSALVKTEVQLENKAINLYLVHTTAPITPPQLVERNRSLIRLAEIINSDKTSKIVFGDFNLTPWSKAYGIFAKNTANSIYNLAKGRGLFFTWRIFKPLSAHIDHVFASSDIKTQKFTTGQALGSDHKLVIADLKI